MKTIWKEYVQNNPSCNFSDTYSTFKDEQLEKVTREMLQNSVDAQARNDVPVHVDIKLLSLEKTRIEKTLRLDDIRRHIKGTISWIEEQDQTNIDAYKLSKDMLECLDKESIQFLKFSDYETKGVPGHSSIDVGKSGTKNTFKNLVMDTGISTHDNASSAGGHGVGKLSTYISSNVRVAFFNTVNNQGQSFLGGGSLLFNSSHSGKQYDSQLWFVNESDDSNDIRFFNQKEAASMSKELFEREKTGTDVVIMAPNMLAIQDCWKEYVAYAVVSNFLLAIYSGKLTVNVAGQYQIKKSSLQNMITLLREDGPKTATFSRKIDDLEAFYSALVSEEANPDYKIEKGNLNGFGEITLFMKKSDDSLPNRVELFRCQGMSLQDVPAKNKGKNYVAIAYITGLEGDKFLKSIEDADHKHFLSISHSTEYSPTVVMERKQRLIDWIQERITDFTKPEHVKVIDLFGLENYIFIPKGGNNLSEKISFQILVPEKNTRGKRNSMAEKAKVKKEPKGDPIIFDTKTHEGKGIKPEHVSPDPDSKENKNGVVDASSKRSGTVKELALASPIQAAGRQKFAFSIQAADMSVSKYSVELSTVDADDNPSVAALPPICSAVDLSTGQKLSVDGNKIVDIENNGRKTICVEFERNPESKIMISPYFIKE